MEIENVYEFLDYLIDRVRYVVGDDMTNKCDLVEGLIGRYLDYLNIKYYACTTNKIIDAKVTGHSFIVMEYNGLLYLIDPSFIQFKYIEDDDLYVKGIRCISKSPYFYANSINEHLCDELITNGYLLINEEVAKFYGNAFYKTKVGTEENEELPMLSGSMIIKLFKTGNDELTSYNIPELKSVEKSM